VLSETVGDDSKCLEMSWDEAGTLLNVDRQRLVEKLTILPGLHTCVRRTKDSVSSAAEGTENLIIKFLSA